MDRFDRIFELNRILQGARRPVSRQRLQDELECSRATVKRLIEDMRLYLNAPIVYDREYNGYRYDQTRGGHVRAPGALVQRLRAARPAHRPAAPRRRPAGLAGSAPQAPAEAHRRPAGAAARRARDGLAGPGADPADGLPAGGPPVPQRSPGPWPSASDSRSGTSTAGADAHSERTVSPQRLSYYRDNWYLDAWCHLREGLRTFALDAIETRRSPGRAGDRGPRGGAGPALCLVLRHLRRGAGPGGGAALQPRAGPLGRQGAVAPGPAGTVSGRRQLRAARSPTATSWSSSWTC